MASSNGKRPVRLDPAGTQVTAGGQRVCHVQIRDVAKAAAGQLYEQVMGNNEYYRIWQKQHPGMNAKQLEREFIEQNWPKCIEFARTTLIALLAKDDVSEATKEQIMVVLEQDYSLRNKMVQTHH